MVFSVFFSGSAFGGELLAYKPYSGALQYTLSIKSHALVDTGSARGYGRIFRDHEDILSLSQKVEEDGDGLLDIATKVDKINVLKHGATYGASYKREDILGNSQNIKINLLGKVAEANFMPHIGSNAFWQRGQDGPPLDIYNVMLLLIPQFPLDLLDAGSTWEIEREIELGLAEALPVAGLHQLMYDLEMTAKHNIKYTMKGFVDKKGYRCAQIGFEVKFRTDGVMRDAHTGNYVDGNGKSSGEFYFAPKEGILVAASMKHNVIERLSKDGQIMFFMNPKERLFLYSYDKTSIPIPWRSERIVSLELAAGK
jgi:hypothetical protein